MLEQNTYYNVMNDSQFDDILKHIYELEGLVMVARRNEADNNLLLPMIQAKAAEINNMLMQETASANDDTSADTCATGNHIEYAPSPDRQTETEETNNEENACTEFPAGTTPDAEPAPAHQEAVTDESLPEASNEADPEQEAPILTEIDDDGNSRHDSDEEPAAEMTFDYVEPQKTVVESEYMPVDNDNTTDIEPTTDTTDETVTVDALLQRNMSRDLKKAFTINDRFRYRRELFGNSDIEMNDALNLVEAMQSYSEAEEYFYDMLNWDKQSPEVADFMSIIRNHFYSK